MRGVKFIILIVLVVPLHACGPFQSVALSPDGRTVVSAGGELLLWDVTTDSVVRAFEGYHSGIRITSVAFSPDGHSIITGEIMLDEDAPPFSHLLKPKQDLFRFGLLAIRQVGNRLLSVGA